MLAIPLEEERSGSEGEPMVFIVVRVGLPGCKVLLPLLPGEEDDVMAVTSASRPSLTTLTASTSVRRPSSSSTSPLLSFRLSGRRSLLLLPPDSLCFSTPCLGPRLLWGAGTRPVLRLRVSTPTTGSPKETRCPVLVEGGLTEGPVGSSLSVGVGKRGFAVVQILPSSSSSPFRFPGGEEVARGRWLGSTVLSGSRAAIRW